MPRSSLLAAVTKKPSRSSLPLNQRELRAYCYRMAGSLYDAEDLLQESLLRAWRALGWFEGRSSLRTWLYRGNVERVHGHTRKENRRARS